MNSVIVIFTVCCIVKSLVWGAVVDRSICYEDLGCFNNSTPHDNTSPILPDPPSRINTKFMIITHEFHHGKAPLLPKPYLLDHINDLTKLNQSLKAANFIPSKKLKILIHGFSQSVSANWIRPMVHALMEAADVNILLVDWGNGAKFPHYLQASANIRVVGEQLRQLLVKLVKLGVKLSNVHMIGHSLGAHVANHASKNLGGKVDQITGLDPAEPLFQDYHKDVRLDESDADFVDVIHTDGKPFYMGGVGVSQPSGHADFFVNGGTTQPGCSSAPIEKSLENLLQGDLKDAVSALTCSHSRAHDIYIESVTRVVEKCHFIAYPCDDSDQFNDGRCLECGTNGCQRLGYHVKIDRPKGKFFLKTRHKPPYCGYHNTIQLVSTGNETAVGRVSLSFVQGEDESDEIILFGHDVTLNEHPLTNVIVTEHPIVNLTGVLVTYHKQESWLPFMSGADIWRPESITVKTGDLEKPLRYRALSEGMEVRSGETKFMKAEMIKMNEFAFL